MAQVITVGGYYFINGVKTFVPNNGQTGLDRNFTYGGDMFPADGTINQISDSLHYPVTQNMTEVGMTHKYETYTIYRPPDADGASGTTWVPLRKTAWNLNGLAKFFAFNQTWIASGKVNVTSDSKTSELPTWTQVITF